jgi:hypothetical protein
MWSEHWLQKGELARMLNEHGYQHVMKSFPDFGKRFLQPNDPLGCMQRSPIEVDEQFEY